MTVTEIPIITAIVYSILAAYKASVSNEKLIKLIPLIAATLGAALGVAAWFIMPTNFANDVFQAIYHGIAAGLAATGLNQVFKQLSKGDEIVTEPAAAEDTATENKK